jgi:hypothetical protein
MVASLLGLANKSRDDVESKAVAGALYVTLNEVRDLLDVPQC